MSNESKATELPLYYQKLGFVYLGLKYDTSLISYEKTDDVALYIKDNKLAVEITVEKNLSITAKNHKFLKSLRNFLVQYKCYEKEKIKFILFTSKHGIDKSKFNMKIFDDIAMIYDNKKINEMENRKVYSELVSCVEKLSQREKELIIQNFDVIVMSEEDCETAILDMLNEIEVIDVKRNQLSNFIHSIFSDYYYKKKSAFELSSN